MSRITVDLRMWRHSGVGRYVRNVFPRLLPLLTANHIRVLGRRATIREADWLADPRVEFVECGARVYSVAEQLLGLRGAYRGTDVLWVPHYNAPLLYRGRLVVTMHDVAPLALPEILSNPLKRAYARLLIERSVAQATSAICVSEFTRGEIQSRLKVPEARLSVVYPALAPEWATAAVTPHHEADRAPYVLFVGNVKPNKNLGALLAAFAAVRERVGYQLIVVGRVRGFGTGDEAAVRAGEALGERVRFAGEVSDDHLRALYAGALALVVPSKYEGFGLTVVEAMTLGCPVVCSEAGALGEVAGDAAMYFDDAASLAECLLQIGSPGWAVTARGMRAAGSARASSFSLDRCARETAAALNAALHER